MSFDDLIPASIGLCLCGLLVFYFGRLLLYAYSSRTWPVANGTLTKVTIDIQQAVRHGARQGYCYYTPSVAYRYDVNGTEYAGSRVYFFDSWPKTESHANRTIEPYDKGERIRVRYHPRNPELATLNPRCSWVVFLPLTFSVFTAASILIELIG